MYLSELGVRSYAAAIWSRRHFLLTLVRMDLRLRYRRTALGIVWSLLNPLLMTGILCFGLATILQRSMSEYAPFLLIGLAFWQFLLNTVHVGSHAFNIAEPYIRQYPAPMAMYTLRATLAAMTHFLIALAVALVLAVAVRGHVNPAALLALVPALLLIVLFGWAVATVCSFLNSTFPDTAQLLETGMQFLYFLTPIIFAPSDFVARAPGFARLLECNPIGWFAELLRAPILRGEPAAPLAWTGAILFAGLFVFLATELLRRWERTLIFKL